jgi:hypothetical protein
MGWECKAGDRRSGPVPTADSILRHRASPCNTRAPPSRSLPKGSEVNIPQVVTLGVLLALVSPTIPDPLSIPGKNLVVFAIVVMAMFFPHALLVSGPSLTPLHEKVECSPGDRLAMICSRLC